MRWSPLNPDVSLPWWKSLFFIISKRILTIQMIITITNVMLFAQPHISASVKDYILLSVQKALFIYLS